MDDIKRQELEQRLAFRRELLTEARNALKALVSGRAKSYQLGSQQLTRLDLGELQDMVKRLEEEVDELQSRLSGAGSRRVTGVIPCDF